jgi:hypothetical protein
MKATLVVLALFFASSPAIVATQPFANSCDAVTSYNPGTGWQSTCDGACPPGQGNCQPFQSGNPVGGAIPLACKCPGANFFITCATQWWIWGQNGAHLGAGCRVPGEACGLGGGDDDAAPVCVERAAPAIPPVGPVPLWYPCVCQ